MPNDESSPTFDFLRATPSNMAGLPPLASSLQSFETSLFLIGLAKYPSALIACATAWESVLKAKLAVGPDERVRLYELLNRITKQFARLRGYDSEKLGQFRTTRNRLVHYGFSPRDDELSAMLLIETGFPFLNLCYQELFDFYLDWEEIRSVKCQFHELTPEENKKAGLLLEVAEHFRSIWKIYRLSKKFDDAKCLSSFHPLRHFIRWNLKETAQSETEWHAMEHADTMGLKFSYEEEIKAKLQRILDPSWNFDCPICNGFETMISELKFDDGKIASDRCACVQCGFTVGKGASYISQAILAAQLADNRAKIGAEFGLE